MGDNKPQGFHSLIQICSNPLRQMCLIICEQEVHRQEVRQDLPLIGCRLDVHQDVCLPLIGRRLDVHRMYACP